MQKTTICRSGLQAVTEKGEVPEGGDGVVLERPVLLPRRNLTTVTAKTMSLALKAMIGENINTLLNHPNSSSQSSNVVCIIRA